MDNVRIAIVTGGAQGIGAAIVREFAAGGILPVIVDRNGEKAAMLRDTLVQSGLRADAAQGDVSRVDDMRALVDGVVQRHGRLDILVNNAGILHGTAIEDITEDEWDNMMAVNLKSVFFLSQAVLPHMTAAGSGRIINLSSLAGRMGGFANGVGYSASKAAVIGLTQAMARRVAHTGVTVNAVAPGTTESEMLQGLTTEKLAAATAAIPVGRLGTPEEIAALVSYIASERSGFLTGAVIDINGGVYS